MIKETLKPCPFCGQKHTTITESNTEGVRIRCPHCNITFTRDFYEHRGELGRQTTIEAWNTRPDMSELEYLNGPWSNVACVGYAEKVCKRNDFAGRDFGAAILPVFHGVGGHADLLCHAGLGHAGSCSLGFDIGEHHSSSSFRFILECLPELGNSLNL